MGNQAKSSAITRIQSIVDDCSFVEIGSMVTARSTDFSKAEAAAPGDGVLTGYATIDQRLVYLYSQDASVLGGSVGEMHARKIENIYNLAMKMGAPVIGLIDCSGLRLEEACDALYGFGRLYKKQAEASGIVPQISAVFGVCGGGMAVSCALSDFVLMEEKNARLFVNAPNAVLGNKSDEIAKAASQKEAGNVDYSGSEEEVCAKIRELISVLPSNNEDCDTAEVCEDDLNRQCPGAERVQAHELIRMVADNGVFVETKEVYAKGMLTGFVRLNGMTVGVVANENALLESEGCQKAAQLIRFCDAFEIPLLTLVDVKGYAADQENEKQIAGHAARLVAAYAEADVPMVSVVTGQAMGTASLAMGAKAVGADIVYAFDNAQIGIMDATEAVKIICADEIAKSGHAVETIAEKAEQFEKKQGSAEAAARRGYVDDIIAPEQIRQRVIAAFEMLFTKRELKPSKKHGTV